MYSDASESLDHGQVRSESRLTYRRQLAAALVICCFLYLWRFPPSDPQRTEQLLSVHPPHSRILPFQFCFVRSIKGLHVSLQPSDVYDKSTSRETSTLIVFEHQASMMKTQAPPPLVMVPSVECNSLIWDVVVDSGLCEDVGSLGPFCPFNFLTTGHLPI